MREIGARGERAIQLFARNHVFTKKRYGSFEAVDSSKQLFIRDQRLGVFLFSRNAGQVEGSKLRYLSVCCIQGPDFLVNVIKQFAV